MSESSITLQTKKMSVAEKKRINMAIQAVSDENVMKEVLESMECPVCMDPLSAPIYMCLAGHNICGSCRLKLTTLSCPLCISIITDQRNFTLEAITAKIFTFPCPNTANGCSVKVSKSKMPEHINKCQFKPFVCTMQKEFGRCTHKVTFLNFLDHFVKQHPRNIGMQIDTELILKSDHFQGHHDVQLIVIDAKLFIYQAKVDVEKNLVLWVVQFVGTNNSARKWNYRININDRDAFKYMSFSAKCCSLSRTSKDIFDSGHCVGVPLNILKNYLREDKRLYFKLQIDPITPDQ